MSLTTLSIILKKEEMLEKLDKLNKDYDFIAVQTNEPSEWVSVLYKNVCYNIEVILDYYKNTDITDVITVIFHEDSGFSISAYKDGILSYSYGIKNVDGLYEDVVFPNQDSFGDKIKAFHNIEFYDEFIKYVKSEKKENKDMIKGLTIFENQLNLQGLIISTYEYLKYAETHNIRTLVSNEQKSDILILIKKKLMMRFSRIGYKAVIRKDQESISFLKEINGFNVGLFIEKDGNKLIPSAITLFGYEYLNLHNYIYNENNIDYILSKIYDDYLAFAKTQENGFDFEEFSMDKNIIEVDDLMKRHSFERCFLSSNVLVGGYISYKSKNIEISFMHNPYRIAVACLIKVDNSISYIDVNQSMSDLIYYYVFRNSREYIKTIETFMEIIKSKKLI